MTTSNGFNLGRIFDGYEGRNRIINGSCVIAQRTTVTGASANTYGGPDRYQALNNASGGTTGIAQSSLTYGGITRSTVLVAVNTVPTTLTGTSYFGGIYQAIEGYNCYDMLGQPAVISFLFAGTIPGTYSVTLCDYSSTNTYVTTFNYTTANAVQKIIINIPTIPTTLNTPQTNGGGMFITIGTIATGTRMCPTASLNTWTTSAYLSAQGVTNWATSVSNSISLTELQFEVGTIATPFERESVAVTFQKCQRYYETGSLYVFGCQIAPNAVLGTVFMQAPKRAGPTYTVAYGSGNQVNTTPTINGLTISQFAIYHVSTGTSGTTYQVAFNDTWTASAEL
jgi:hypothetical protein